jgi:predicted aconitase with swiveling domain
MKKIFLLLVFCLIPLFAHAEDVKIYDRDYKYIGKVDATTGNIYDKDYHRVGKVDKTTGKVYDSNYKRSGSVTSTIRGGRR